MRLHNWTRGVGVGAGRLLALPPKLTVQTIPPWTHDLIKPDWTDAVLGAQRQLHTRLAAQPPSCRVPACRAYVHRSPNHSQTEWRMPPKRAKLAARDREQAKRRVADDPAAAAPTVRATVAPSTATPKRALGLRKVAKHLRPKRGRPALTPEQQAASMARSARRTAERVAERSAWRLREHIAATERRAGLVVRCDHFTDARAGAVFKLGDCGIGFYRDVTPPLTPSPPLPSPPSLGERAQHAVRRICDRLHGTFVPAAGQRLKDVPTVTTHGPTDDATLLSFLQESLAKAWRPSFYCVASRPGCAFSADAPACDACHRLRAAVHGLTSDAVLHHPNTLDRVLCGQEVHERQMQECFDAFWESNKHACRPPPVWTPSQRCSAPASCGARGDASYCAACVAKWDAGASRGWTVVE